MKRMDRRGFLKVVGVGSMAAAAATVPAAGLLAADRIFAFRAVAGLPKAPWPAYASYVVEGHVDFKTRSGVVTQRLFAGFPEAKSTIAWPGLSRTVRVTNVQRLDGSVQISGVIDDHSQLRLGESPAVEITIDRSRGVAHTQFIGSEVLLRLER